MNNNQQVNLKTKDLVKLNKQHAAYSKQGSDSGDNTSQSILDIARQQGQNTKKIKVILK